LLSSFRARRDHDPALDVEQEYWEQEPPPFRSEVACAIRHTASCKATGHDQVLGDLFKAGGEGTGQNVQNVWRSGKLMSS